MLDKVKISIDVMGGDNSPDKTLEGLDIFIKRNQNISDYIFYLFAKLSSRSLFFDWIEKLLKFYKKLSFHCIYGQLYYFLKYHI